MNDLIQDGINGLAGHASFIDTLMKLSARDLIYLAPVLLLGLWLWPERPRERSLNQRLAAAAFVAVLLALGFAEVLRQMHYQARPFVTDPSTNLLIDHAADNSFPSDHTTVAFAVGGTVIWWRRLVGAVTLALAAVVGFARIYVGVHWPADVLAAAGAGLLAGAFAAIALPLLEPLQRRLSRLLPAALISAP